MTNSRPAQRGPGTNPRTIRNTSRLVAIGQPTSQADPACQLPAQLGVDDTDTPADLVDALILAEFATGRQPYAHTVRLDQVRPDAPLLPPGAAPVRVAVEHGRIARLATGPGWTVRAVRWRAGDGEVTVTAVTDELARAMLEQATRDVAAPKAPDRAEMGFWHTSPRRGPSRVTRRMAAEPWAAIRGNYTADAAAALDTLMAMTPDSVTGRLLLLYGPPGTGKTTALRTLAREWRQWCQADCVLDPETLFSEPGYLMDVAIGEEDEDDNDDDGDAAGPGGSAGARWRLLLLEDCDELIRAEAKQAAGQALSRLLNLTDGLLGQGRNVLVAITTNEDLNRLHPAAIRPGRCLAQVEVGLLSAAEATAWLGRSPRPSSPATLAELYELRSGVAPVRPRPRPEVGLYL